MGLFLKYLKYSISIYVMYVKHEVDYQLHCVVQPRVPRLSSIPFYFHLCSFSMFLYYLFMSYAKYLELILSADYIHISYFTVAL